MKRFYRAAIYIAVIALTFVSCSTIPVADIDNPSPYAMFITLDVPGKLTSPMYYVNGEEIKKIDEGLYGILLNNYTIIYLKQTANMDNPDLMYKNLKTGRTVKLISGNQFGTIIGMIASPQREKIILHIWPDGIATGNNLFIMLDKNNILKNPTNIHITMLGKGKLYSIIKWIAAVSDDGSIVYVGSNGAPDEALVYRDKTGKEKIISKYKANGDFDAIINQGLTPPYQVAYIDQDKVYLLGKSGVWTYLPASGELKLKYPLSSVPSEGLWIDKNSSELIVWGFKLGKATIKIYNLDGNMIQTASGVRISDPRIINGKLFAIGYVKEKTVYSYTIGEVNIMNTSSITLKRMFISKDDIKWWDIIAQH